MTYSLDYLKQNNRMMVGIASYGGGPGAGSFFRLFAIEIGGRTAIWIHDSTYIPNPEPICAGEGSGWRVVVQTLAEYCREIGPMDSGPIERIANVQGYEADLCLLALSEEPGPTVALAMSALSNPHLKRLHTSDFVFLHDPDVAAIAHWLWLYEVEPYQELLAELCDLLEASDSLSVANLRHALQNYIMDEDDSFFSEHTQAETRDICIGPQFGVRIPTDSSPTLPSPLEEFDKVALAASETWQKLDDLTDEDYERVKLW